MASPPRHRYGSGSSQFGELLRPDAAGPHPVAVIVHGGFWRAVHGRKVMWPVCGAVAQLLGGTPEEVPDRFAAASPAALVPIGVPVLCVHGALDATVPVSISESFAEKARLAGDEVELRVFDGEDHEGHLDPANAMWRAAAGWLDRLRR